MTELRGQLKIWSLKSAQTQDWMGKGQGFHQGGLLHQQSLEPVSISEHEAQILGRQVNN